MKLKTAKEVIQSIVLVGILNSFAVFLANALAGDKWRTFSIWGWLGLAVFVLATLVVLYTLLRAIGRLDVRIDEDRKKENEALVKDLAKAINEGGDTRDQRLINALQSAIQEQGKTIVKVMREPIDAHE